MIDILISPLRNKFKVFESNIYAYEQAMLGVIKNNILRLFAKGVRS